MSATTVEILRKFLLIASMVAPSPGRYHTP